MKGFKGDLLDERIYSFTINGRSIATVAQLTGNQKEFAYGYLKTEGIVEPAEIDSVMVDESNISVLTRDTSKVLLPKKTIISGCGGTASYLDPEKLPDLESRMETPKLSFKFASPILKYGGFAAAVISESRIFEADDLSQSGSIDKSIGMAILANTNLSGSVLVISGKVTGDIIRKVLHAGISVLFSAYPPTAMAKEMADAKKLKLEKI